MFVKLFFLVVFSISLHALALDQNSSDIKLLNHSKIFIDKQGIQTKQTIEDLEFIPSTKSSLNLGIVPKTIVWVEFTLKNSTSKKLTKILEYNNVETEDIVFYDGEKEIREGMFHHPKDRSTLNPVFLIELEPHEERRYLLQAHCKISTLVVELTLWNKQEFEHSNQIKMIVLLLFFSILLTLLIYNFLLFVFLDDILYFYYAFFLTAVIFFETINLGVAQLYIFSNEVMRFITEGSMFYIVFLAITIGIFTMHFLQTHRFKILHNIFKYFMWTLPVIAILSFDNIVFDLNILVIFIFPLFLMFVSAAYAYYKGTKEAIVYLVGWSFIIASLVLSIVHYLGWENIFYYFPYINELAFILEAFTFSLALAYRFKLLDEERALLNAKLISVKTNEHLRMESLVFQQTKKLQTALDEKELLYKELQHRIKNNLSMIISLLELQVSNSSDEETIDALNAAKFRINAFAKLYEGLYFQDEQVKYSTKNYFEKIVENILINFKQDIEIVYDINYNIPSKYLFYCGLILNELVTNSCKYAFEEKGTITITTFLKNDFIYMIVKDNGKGYTQSYKNSLGLTLIKTLSEDQLFGKVVVDSINGTNTTILWKEKN